jgi:hypothetical protein
MGTTPPCSVPTVGIKTSSPERTGIVVSLGAGSLDSEAMVTTTNNYETNIDGTTL